MKELWRAEKLEAELEAAKDDLKGLEQNIRKILGRDVPEGENGSVQPATRVPQKRPLQDERRRQPTVGFPNNDSGPKRRFAGGPNAEPKTVFSRLSARVTSTADDSGDEDDGTIKPAVSSRIIATPREVPSRQEVIRRESTDERSRQRNRRMFGALLGTLQKFRQEETKLKAKEDKKAEVEARVEEAKRKEREELKKERQQLFLSRKQQLAQVKALEAKLARSKQYQEWRSAQIPLLNFIKTKAQPPIYYLPKRSTPQTDTLLQESSKELKALIDKREKELLEDLDLIQKQAGLGKNQLDRSLSASESQNQSMAEEPEVENRDPNHEKNREIKNSDINSKQAFNHDGEVKKIDSGEKMDLQQNIEKDMDVDKISEGVVFESSGKNFDFDRNSDKEDDRNSDKDDRNSDKEDDRNSDKDDRNSDKDDDRHSEKDNDRNSANDDDSNSENNYIKNLTKKSRRHIDINRSSEKDADYYNSIEKKLNSNKAIEADSSLVDNFDKSIDFEMDRSKGMDINTKSHRGINFKKCFNKDAESDQNSDKDTESNDHSDKEMDSDRNSDKKVDTNRKADKEVDTYRNDDKEVDTDKNTKEESDKKTESDDEGKKKVHTLQVDRNEKCVDTNYDEGKQNDDPMQLEKIELPGETYD